MADPTWDSDGATPSGSWLGSNVLKLLDTVTIKDNQNSDVWVSKGVELYYKAYLLSIIDTDEFLMNKGAVREPVTDSAAITAINLPILFLKELPKKIYQQALKLQ